MGGEDGEAFGKERDCSVLTRPHMLHTEAFCQARGLAGRGFLHHKDVGPLLYNMYTYESEVRTAAALNVPGRYSSRCP